jgi:glycosyltransferase involved in cell wall biosynthesis
VTAPVAIDGRAAARREIGGVERLAREMAHRLPRLRPGRYRVLRPPPALAFRAGHLWEQALPLAFPRAELFYCPANLAPIASVRNVVVIHDVAALRRPDAYGRAYVAYQRRLLPAIARRARLVITVSEFSRAEIAELLSTSPERIAVVPNGVDERFSPSADPGPARARHGLERPYVLVLGSRTARKNLGALRSAARRLAEAGIELVAGGSGRGYMRPEHGLPVRPLGYVEEALLPGLYAGAAAFAMPSLYEGFGLPCLEAMACGAPVVASNRGALPETCGDAALLVDPDDGDAFADAVRAAATEEGLRDRLVGAGRERAARFTWERAAEGTDALIGELLGGGR